MSSFSGKKALIGGIHYAISDGDNFVKRMGFITATGIFEGKPTNSVKNSFYEFAKKVSPDAKVDFEEVVPIEDVTFYPQSNMNIGLQFPFTILFSDQIIGVYLLSEQGNP